MCTNRSIHLPPFQEPLLKALILQTVQADTLAPMHAQTGLFICHPFKNPIKIKWEEEINHTTIELLYTYISWLIVDAVVSIRILDQLMRQITTSNRWMDWQKYPKNRKSIRIQQPKTLDSKTCPVFAVVGGNTLVCIAWELETPLQFFPCSQRF